MRSLFFLFIFCNLTACSSKHEGVYIYNSQAYTTTKVSEFEVDHYKAFGNTNFLAIINSDKSRTKEIKELCLKYAVECKTLNVSTQSPSTINKIVEAYKSFGEEKFFVFSPDKKTTAIFSGTIEILVNKGNSKSLKILFNELNIKDSTEIEQELISLKN